MKCVINFQFLVCLLIFNSSGFAMDCRSDSSITGEYWSYQSPKLYTFKYFDFFRATGGMASAPARLEAEFNTNKIDELLDKILLLKKVFPYSGFALRHRDDGDIKLTISDYMIFDYDIAFALGIESLLDEQRYQGKLNEPKGSKKWASPTFYRQEIRPTHVNFSEKGISWVHTSPDSQTGLEKQRLRIDMHHEGMPKEKEFFAELRSLLDESNVEYLDYREFSYNYMVFLGNGRQGINPNEISCSNFQNFKDKIFLLLDKYSFRLGHRPKAPNSNIGMSDYNSLVESKVKIVKDDCRK